MAALSITVVDSAPTLYAYVRRQATLASIPAVAAASPVWGKAFELGLKTSSAISLFWDDGTGRHFEEPGVPVDVGAVLLAPFGGHPVILQGTTPAGRTATALVRGPIAQLPGAHRAIRDWCLAAGEALAGPAWDIHRWNPDPELSETDVHYLLA